MRLLIYRESEDIGLDVHVPHETTVALPIIILMHITILLRDEKEGRKKQARSNKQQGKGTQHTQDSFS